MKEKRHSTELLFVIFLFFLFTLSALVVMLLGARVYQMTASRMQSNYTVRTALAYVSEKVHQNDRSGAILLDELSGTPALTIVGDSAQADCLTHIYFYDGALRELFVRKDAPFTLSQGSPIVELASFSMEANENACLSFTASDAAGETLSLCVHIRSEEVQPS